MEICPSQCCSENGSRMTEPYGTRTKPLFPNCGNLNGDLHCTRNRAIGTRIITSLEKITYFAPSQKAQYPLIKEYTENGTRVPNMI